jgi:molybdate transport system ATP-binding protein
MLEVDVRKRYSHDGLAALDLEVQFQVNNEIAVLFGPSGAGKTTTLLMIAGIVAPDAGTIRLNGERYFDSAGGVNRPLQKRGVGFVFQDYLLFPHMTALQNVEYGARESSPAARRRCSLELLELFGISSVAQRRPHSLSGGEQQRVALARALASRPSLLLLDEPLSAVDVSTRARLLREIRQAQRAAGIPFLYVTHHRADMVRIGDAALLLHAGRILQRGNPVQVLNTPASMSAARVLGPDNLLLATIAEQRPEEGLTVLEAEGCRLLAGYMDMPVGREVTVGISSEDIIVSPQPVAMTSARNLLSGSITSMIEGGGHLELLANCGVNLRVSITRQAVKTLGLAPGVPVYLLIKANACHIIE